MFATLANGVAMMNALSGGYGAEYAEEGEYAEAE